MSTVCNSHFVCVIYCDAACKASPLMLFMRCWQMRAPRLTLLHEMLAGPAQVVLAADTPHQPAASAGD
jgi:hypothetical protein